MTTSKEVETAAGPLDTVLLVVAALSVLGSLVAYYYFEATPVVIRVLGILLAMGLAAVLVYNTQLGQGLWQFIQGSRVEIRKVIWPNRQETTSTTVAVFIFVLIFGIFFWLLDMFLRFFTRALTGLGG